MMNIQCFYGRFIVMIPIRNAKIVCTIGPASSSPKVIEKLIKAGMDVARLNFSHGTHDEHKKVIKSIRDTSRRLKKAVAILQDLQGPKIRTGLLKDGRVVLKSGNRFILTGRKLIGTSEIISTTYPAMYRDVKKGDRILLDDGLMSLKVHNVKGTDITCEVINGGVLTDHKGINLPGIKVGLSSITKKDIEDLYFGIGQCVDYVAISFVRTDKDVKSVKDIIKKGGVFIPVIAKLEKPEAIDNLEKIMDAADGLMVARGDLGVEMSPEAVPVIQKNIINMANRKEKPVITATQMLESMINNPRPTRAEASDVANAIYDSTSAVMLSGETAAGKYPIEAVKIMRRIVKEAERGFSYRDFFHVQSRQPFRDISISVAVATVSTAYNAGAKAIFVLTNSGLSSRILARFRPSMPILALSPKLKTYHQLALNWGVIPVPSTFAKNEREALEIIGAYAKKIQEVQEGDLIVLSAGTPFGVSGSTNLMLVENIGDVAVRGQPGFGSLIHGQIKIVHSPEEENEENLDLPMN